MSAYAWHYTLRDGTSGTLVASWIETKEQALLELTTLYRERAHECVIRGSNPEEDE